MTPTWNVRIGAGLLVAFAMLAVGQRMLERTGNKLLRDTLEVVTSFGDGGRWPGTFFGVHSIATDSKGNIYTTETYEGKRVQRFLYKGLGPVPAASR